MSRQYPLPLPHIETMGVEDFMVAPCNREAFQWIEAWPQWPSPALIIHGQSGCGKTHLAEVWRARSQGQIISVATLDNNDARDIVTQNARLVIENADQFTSSPSREENLFHLYNLVRELKGSLLLTATTPPAQWNIQLADLRSRLLAAPAVLISPPDDELLSAMIIKQFHDRQISVGNEIIDYIVPRLERTAAAVRDVVNAMDSASLSERRGITVALAKRILEEQHSLDERLALD